MSREKIEWLELLKAFPQWQYLQSELEECLEEVQREINREKKTVIDRTYDDVLKRERAVLEMLINLPDTLISDIRNTVIEERDE